MYELDNFRTPDFGGDHGNDADLSRSEPYLLLVFHCVMMNMYVLFFSFAQV